MAVEFTDLQPVQGADGWWVLLGQDNKGPVQHHFSIEALQYRAAEYGLDSNDIQGLFEIIFNEALVLTFTAQELAELGPPVNPYDHIPEQAKTLKNRYMAKVKETQGRRLGQAQKIARVDRTELADRLAQVITDVRDYRLERFLLLRTPMDVQVKKFALDLLTGNPGIHTAELAIRGAQFAIEHSIPPESLTVEEIQNDEPLSTCPGRPEPGSSGVGEPTDGGNPE